jgi:hypothetical protein
LLAVSCARTPAIIGAEILVVFRSVPRNQEVAFDDYELPNVSLDGARFVFWSESKRSKYCCPATLQPRPSGGITVYAAGAH